VPHSGLLSGIFGLPASVHVAHAGVTGKKRPRGKVAKPLGHGAEDLTTRRGPGNTGRPLTCDASPKLDMCCCCLRLSGRGVFDLRQCCETRGEGPQDRPTFLRADTWREGCAKEVPNCGPQWGIAIGSRVGCSEKRGVFTNAACAQRAGPRGSSVGAPAARRTRASRRKRRGEVRPQWGRPKVAVPPGPSPNRPR
jgi:hypothetical protein